MVAASLILFGKWLLLPALLAFRHLDSNHKLVRWRLVIHGGIDGYSRVVVFLKCASNNQSETVLENFMEACERFHVPTHVRTDHGTENVAVARAMLEIKGAETNPVLTGRSVHNQRIERLWVDLGAQVIHYFRDVFHHQESCCNLDPLNELHLFAHFVFLPRINRMLAEFITAWNHHPMRTSRNLSSLQIWTQGFCTSANKGDLLHETDPEFHLYGVDWDGPFPEFQTNNTVIPELNVNIDQGNLEYIMNSFNPLHDNGNHGINLYNKILRELTIR